MDQYIAFRSAIDSQPDQMSHTARAVTDALAAQSVAPWQRHETVAVVGMGASSHAGTVFVEALRAAGQRAVNLDASAVARYPAGAHLADHVIVISESGRSPEPIAAATTLGVPPIVLTNNLASPAARLADVLIPLGEVADSSVHTVGYVATLVALAGVAQACGVDLVDPASLAGVAAATLADVTAVSPALAEAISGRRFLDIVGQGLAYGSAHEAALLFREATGTPTAAHETIQYLHGPMEACGRTGAALIYGDAREHGIAQQLRDAGVQVWQFDWAPGPADPGLIRLSQPADGYAAAVAQVIVAQLVAADLADLRGIQAGQFRFQQTDTKLPL